MVSSTVLRDLGIRRHALGARRRGLVEQNLRQAREDVALQDREFVVAVLGQTFFFGPFDGQRALVLVDAVTVEDAHFHDRAGDARRNAQRGVAHIGRFFAEDGAQQLFFRRHRGFALRRHLADQNIARIHFRADIDDARFVEVLEVFLADIRDVARDFLRPELGIARHGLEFFDMDRSEDVVAHDAFGDQDRVFEVVAIPRHEGDERILAERQLAELGRGTIGDDIALLKKVADLHQRRLRDAGRLVGALELLQAINVDARLGRIGFFRGADNDTRGVDLVDNTRAARRNGRAGVACDHVLQSGADQRRFRPQQRHGLALHVRAHQRAVGVVVFEERHQRRGHRHKLLRRHVDELHLIGRRHHEVAMLAAGDQFVGDAPARVDRSRWPGRWCTSPLPSPTDTGHRPSRACCARGDTGFR